MDNNELMQFSRTLSEYLNAEKNHIPNITRFREINEAIDIAREIYPEHEIALAKDPLQMGALYLEIIGDEISAIGEREIELFQKLIDKADNFETISIDNKKIRLSICFADAFQITLK